MLVTGGSSGRVLTKAEREQLEQLPIEDVVEAINKVGRRAKKNQNLLLAGQKATRASAKRKKQEAAIADLKREKEGAKTEGAKTEEIEAIDRKLEVAREEHSRLKQEEETQIRLVDEEALAFDADEWTEITARPSPRRGTDSKYFKTSLYATSLYATSLQRFFKGVVKCVH